MTSKLINVVPLVNINKVDSCCFVSSEFRCYVFVLACCCFSWIVILQLFVEKNFITLIFLIITGVELGCYKLVSEQVGLSGQCHLMLSIPLYAISVWNTVGTCCVSDLLSAGFELELSGGEALLLGCVLFVRCWFSMLLMATVNILLKFGCVVSRGDIHSRFCLLIKLERLEGGWSNIVDVYFSKDEEKCNNYWYSGRG